MDMTVPFTMSPRSMLLAASDSSKSAAKSCSSTSASTAVSVCIENYSPRTNEVPSLAKQNLDATRRSLQAMEVHFVCDWSAIKIKRTGLAQQRCAAL